MAISNRPRAFITLGCLALVLAATPALGEGYESKQLPNLISCYGSASTPDGTKLFTVSDNSVIGIFDMVEEHYVEAIDLRDLVSWTTGGVVAQGKLYVESFTHVVVIDIATKEVVAFLEQDHFLGSHFGALVATADESTVWAIVGSTTRLTAVDTATDTIAAEVEVGGNFTGVALSPDEQFVYVSDKKAGRLLIVDTEAMEIVGETGFTTEEGGFLEFPTSIAVGPAGTVYVSYVGDDFVGRVAVLDAQGNLQRTFKAASYSTGIAVTGDGEFLILGNGQVLATQFGDTAAQFVLPVGLSSVALGPSGTRAFITNINAQYLYSIEGFEPLLSMEGSLEIGGEIVLHLNVPNDADRMFQILASVGVDQGIPLPSGRTFPLDDDYLLRYTRDNAGDNPIFQGFVAFLDEDGRGSAVISVNQELLDLLGENRTFYVAFASVWEPPPSKANVKTISNVLTLTLPDPAPEAE